MTRLPDIDPVEQPGMHASHDASSKVFTHPAFGVINVSRIQAGGKGVVLNGTDFHHHSFISLTIRESELHRDVSRDWHHGTKHLLELWMSEAQWAAFVSSFNIGAGTPVTLQFANNEEKPGITYRQQTDDFRNEVRQTLKDSVDALDKALAAVEAEVGTLSQKKKDVIFGAIKKAKQELVSNLPFVTKSFEQHIENTIEHAKVEVNSYATLIATQVGIANLGGTQPPISIGAGETKEGTDG